jgi:hypothetical protein
MRQERGNSAARYSGLDLTLPRDTVLAVKQKNGLSFSGSDARWSWLATWTVKPEPDREGPPSWQWTKRWTANRLGTAPTWTVVIALKKEAEEALRPCSQEYQRLNQRWQHKLQALCGKFTRADWARFRPLRLSREEDWSDWLAWLLENSATGLLARTVFAGCMGCNCRSFRLPRVEREVPTEDRKRRADIVIEWDGGQDTQIEVKVGDEEFEKTFETCRGVRAMKPENAWYDTILIPDGSKGAWDAVAEEHAEENSITVVLWGDIARGLRKCLWEERESIFWRVWAWAFCCAIEDRLLHLERPDLSKAGINQLVMASRWTELLAPNAGGTA